MQKKDSLGNDLPSSVFLRSEASLEEISKAQTVNSFNLAAAIALEKGHCVIYDKNQKQATITDEKGFTYFITHS